VTVVHCYHVFRLLVIAWLSVEIRPSLRFAFNSLPSSQSNFSYLLALSRAQQVSFPFLDIRMVAQFSLTRISSRLLQLFFLGHLVWESYGIIRCCSLLFSPLTWPTPHSRVMFFQFYRAQKCRLETWQKFGARACSSFVLVHILHASWLGCFLLCEYCGMLIKNFLLWLAIKLSHRRKWGCVFF
jgi:hypothetical protein